MKKGEFYTDKQTLDDLNLTGKYKSDSIFSLFNRTKTTGGERLLEQSFQQPFSRVQPIQERIDILRDFLGKSLVFPVDGETFTSMERYFSNYPRSGKFQLWINAAKRKFQSLIGVKEEGNYIRLHLHNTCLALNALQPFLSDLMAKLTHKVLKDEVEQHHRIIKEILSSLSVPFSEYTPENWSWTDVYRAECLFRNRFYKEVKEIISFCHTLDFYLSVADVASERGFSFPMVDEDSSSLFELTDAYHPSLKNAVGNTIRLDKEQNFLFLTGANMAGKSTWMKTLGVCYYLAHMGFPVPAASMRFSTKQGIFTSINLPDNLSKGYSHFYAEVVRVKQVAQEVASGKRLLIIFDELFKGTNVKDAFDATLAVSRSFSEYNRCSFVISTHIVEVGEALKESNQNIQYEYLPTIMEGSKATYPYRIAKGISDDRHGMMIIRQEGILDSLASVKN